MRFDQPQRLAADEDRRVVSLAPAERGNVSVLAQRSAAVSFLEARLERCPDVRIGTAVEEQSRERRIIRTALAVVDPEVVLRHNRRVERGVAAEAVAVRCRWRVRTHAALEEPVRNLQLVEVSRSEEHTSELQSHVNLVCRLLLEKKKTAQP